MEELFTAALPGSAALRRRADSVLAGGTTHDGWRLDPFPPVFVRASGPYKWDVDRRKYVDFWMGHGALLLGHSHPAVVDALAGQSRQAAHLAGLHPALIEWAERIATLVPSAERVRFTSSGTEATLLAFRIARAFTGQPTIIRFDGHFHGWHDESLALVVDAASCGLRPDVGAFVEVLPPDNLDALSERLSHMDVAGVVLEPGGGSAGILPWSGEGLRVLRELTRRAGTLLIFDEVISGFRYAPGGVQAMVGVTPDLTVLAKILCGGCPGGAVVGLEEIMGVFASDLSRRGAIVHTGTFNGNPLSAAAGIATLNLIADGSAQKAADDAARIFVIRVNECAERLGIEIALFAQSSVIHVLIGERGSRIAAEPSATAFSQIRKNSAKHARLRCALLISGVDMHTAHGWVSATHDEDAMHRAAQGFESAFRLLREDAEFMG